MTTKLPQLLEFIGTEIDPYAACSKLGFCSNSQAEAATAQVLEAAKEGGSIECSLCLVVAEVIEKALASNATDQQIVADVEQVCNVLPGSLKDEVRPLNRCYFLRISKCSTLVSFFTVQHIRKSVRNVRSAADRVPSEPAGGVRYAQTLHQQSFFFFFVFF